MDLPIKQTKFVIEYCRDWNAPQAAIRAGYSKKTADSQASRLLKSVKIAAAVRKRKEQLAAAAGLDSTWVLTQWLQIASADPAELMQLRRVNCRHCHGFDHAYQWTEAEFVAATDSAIASKKPAPDGIGGFGFDVNAEPNPECPECSGNGVELVHIVDTRKLSGAAKRLFAGVRKTKDGIQILTRNQDAALENIAKYLGMMVDRKEISGPGGGPMPVATLTAEDLTDDQLAAIIAGNADA